MYALPLASINPVILQIDFLVALLCCLVVVHVIYYTRASGVRCIQTILLSSFFIERLSIRLGDTHCHADGSVMVAKCSSLNSILFYVPWMYACWAAGLRLGKALELPPLQLSLLIGLLHPLFCVPYELTGANKQWWQWGKNLEALGDRAFNVPIMTVMFHFTFGLFLILSQGYIEPWFLKKRNFPASRLIPSSFFTFLLPTTVCCITTQVGSVIFLTLMGIVEHLVPSISRRSLSVGILVWSAAIVLNWIVLYYIRSTSALEKERNAMKQKLPLEFSRPDWLLFSIPCLFLMFILYCNREHILSAGGDGHLFKPWSEIEHFVQAVVVVVSTALIVFAMCCLSSHRVQSMEGKSQTSIAKQAAKSK